MKNLNEVSLDKISGGSKLENLKETLKEALEEGNIICVCKICGNTFNTYNPNCENCMIMHGTRQGFHVKHRMDYCSKCMKKEIEKQTFLNDINNPLKS